MSSIDIFNSNVEEFDLWYERYHWVYQSELFAIERLLPRRVNAVEIGVGSGRFSKPFGIRIGLDPCENMLKLAKKRNIEGVSGKAEELPFCNESFKLILMVTTISFLNNIYKSFKEAYRVLKPGGQLVIGFIDRLSPLGRMYEQKKEESMFFKQANFCSPEELTELLYRAHFDDIFFVQTLFRPLDKIDDIEPVKNGYGRGSFVVLRSVKI